MKTDKEKKAKFRFGKINLDENGEYETKDFQLDVPLDSLSPIPFLRMDDDSEMTKEQAIKEHNKLVKKYKKSKK